MRLNKVAAETLLFQLAHEPFKLPGDSGFTLGGLLSPPADKQEEGFCLTSDFCCRLNIA